MPTNPTSANNGAFSTLYDPVAHQDNVAQRIVNIQTDATTGIQYGDIASSTNIAQIGGIATQMGVSNGTLANLPMFALGLSNGGTSIDVWREPNGLGDGQNFGMATMASYLFRGDGNWDKQRTPLTFKTATATASGNTAVWTPTSGKKFRLMGYIIYVTNDASLASAGDIDITFQDATTGLGFGFSLFVPSAAGTTIGQNDSKWISLGNGYLSGTANNVLNVNLSTALATGKVRITAIGTEE